MKFVVEFFEQNCECEINGHGCHVNVNETFVGRLVIAGVFRLPSSRFRGADVNLRQTRRGFEFLAQVPVCCYI